MTRTQASSDRGKPVQWTVSAWTTGGNAAHATISLKAAPADSGKPSFTFGCGSSDGTSSCDLGTLDAQSTPRQLRAQLTVPATAATVTSVRLIASGDATDLVKAPTASATVAITTPARTAKAANSPTPQHSRTQAAPTVQPVVPGTLPPVTVISPLPVGSLPGIPTLSPSKDPAVNAASLFPTLAPKPTASSDRRANTRSVGNTSALRGDVPIAGAQAAGLAALALAFVLAVTHLSIRRRHPAKPSSPESADQPGNGDNGADDQDNGNAPTETPPTDGE